MKFNYKNQLILLAAIVMLSACKRSSETAGSSSAFGGFQSESAPSPSPEGAHGGSPVGDGTSASSGSSGSSGDAPFINPNGTETTMDYSAIKINSQGLLEGANVINQESKVFQDSRGFGSQGPKGIILHKTAGKTCGNNNSIPEGLRGPHVFVCQSGKIIVTGSFDSPRTFSELGHNDWSLNIEFESPYEKSGKAACASRGELTLGGFGHCYEPLNSQQVEAGKKIISLLSKRYNIPQQLTLPVNSQEQYTSNSTAILPKNVITTGTPLNKTVDQMPKGIVPSFWTRQYNGDSKNHDDAPSWEDLKKLGIIN